MRKLVIAALAGTLVVMPHAVRADAGQDALQKALEKCTRQHTEIRDMTVIQEITIPTPEGTIMAEQKSYEKGEKSRMEMTMRPPAGADTSGMPPNMGMVTTISDGKTTWMISPMMGKQEIPDKNDPSSANCWGLKLEHARVTGSDKLDGRECWIVESGRPDSISDRYWLDKVKFDVVKGESRDPEGNVLHWQLSDFRPLVGPYEYPYKMEVYNGDTVVAAMKVKSLVINTGLADTLFDADRIEVKKRDLDELLRRMMEQQGTDTLAPEPEPTPPVQK